MTETKTVRSWGRQTFLSRWNRVEITQRQAMYILITAHLAVSAYWLSQAGFFIIKDSAVYLAIARRTAEIAFFANPYDHFPATNFILTNGPFYAYLINALQKLPGGFPPYQFALGQLLHFVFIASVFRTVQLWRGVKAALLVALVGMFEPLHYMDILAIKPSVFSQPTIGIGMCLAAWGWKKQRSHLFIWSAVVLGLGTIFRPFNIAFVPLLLLLVWLTGRGRLRKLVLSTAVISITGLSTMPRTLFNSANPELNVQGIPMYFLFVSNRLEQDGQFTRDNIPKTLEYYYSLTPRLRDPRLVTRYKGSSLPFYSAFRHERVYRYGDTPAEAETHYYIGGLKALMEAPGAYLEATVKTFLRHWGISIPPLNGFDYQLRLWIPRPANEPFFTLPPYGNTMLRMFACSAPFEICLEQPAPDLMPKSMIRSLQRMVRPTSISFVLGQIWEKASPFRGVLALALLVFSVVWLRVKREGEALLFFGGVIAIYLGILTFLVLATTQDIIMILPWIAFVTMMALTSPGKNGETTP